MLEDILDENLEQENILETGTDVTGDNLLLEEEETEENKYKIKTDKDGKKTAFQWKTVADIEEEQFGTRNTDPEWVKEQAAKKREENKFVVYHKFTSGDDPEVEPETSDYSPSLIKPIKRNFKDGEWSVGKYLDEDDNIENKIIKGEPYHYNGITTVEYEDGTTQHFKTEDYQARTKDTEILGVEKDDVTGEVLLKGGSEKWKVGGETLMTLPDVQITDIRTTENLANLKKRSYAPITKDEINNAAEEWEQGSIFTGNEEESINQATKLFGGLGITFEPGTHTGDNYIKVRLPNDELLDWSLKVGGDKEQSIEQYKKLTENLTKNHLHKLERFKYINPTDYDKQYIFKNANLNLNEVVNYDEDSYEDWLNQLLPNSQFLGEQRGAGDAYKYAIPNIGSDGKVKTTNFDVNLQPNIDITGDIARAAFGGGENTVIQYGIVPALKYAEWRHANPRRAAVYTDWTPNQGSDGPISSGETVREIKNLSTLNNVYKEAVGMEILSTGSFPPTYVVKKDGKEIFRGSSVYSTAGVDSYVSTDGEVKNYRNNIQDFMTNYDWSAEELQALSLARSNAVKKVEGNRNKTNFDLAYDRESEYTNLAAANNYTETEALPIHEKAIDNAEQDLIKEGIEKFGIIDDEGNITQHGSYSATGELLGENAKKLIEKHGGKLEFSEELEAYVFSTETDDPKVRKEFTEMSKALNGWYHQYSQQLNLHRDALTDIQDRRLGLQDLYDASEKKTTALMRNYNPGAKMAYGWQKSWKQLGYNIVGLVAPSVTKDASEELDKRYQTMFAPQLTFDRAMEEDRFWEYAGNVTTENGAITTLSILTAGAGSLLNVGARTIQWTIGGIAGVSAGGQKNIELANIADEIKNIEDNLLPQLDQLLADEKITQAQYDEKRTELENFIDDNTYSALQRTTSVLGATILEGTVTATMGARNYTKFGENVLNPTKNFVKDLTRGNWRAAGRALKQTGGGVGLEVGEEELIYFGDALMDWKILDRKFDISQYEKVGIDAAIVAGPMVGSGATYSTVMTQVANKDIRNEINDVKNNLSDIQKRFRKLKRTDIDYEKEKKMLMRKKQEQFDRLGLKIDEVELMSMSLDPKDLDMVLSSGFILDNLNLQAGIDPRFDNNKKNQLLKKYVGTLSKDKAKNFMEKYNNAINAKKSALRKMGGFDLTVKRVYGEQAQTILDDLIKTNPTLKDADSKEKALAIHKEFKKRLNDSYINKARANPYVVDMVQRKIYGSKYDPNKKGKIRYKTKATIQAENDLYSHIGKQISMDIDKAIVISKEEGRLASEVLRDIRLKDLNLTVAPDDGVLQEEVMQAYDDMAQQDIDRLKKKNISKEEMESLSGIIKARRDAEAQQHIDALRNNELNAIIVGGKYIVKDKKAADKALEQGYLLAGTAISHEVGHAIDYLAFDEAGVTNYGKNLHNYMEKNFPEIHAEAQRIQAVIGNFDATNGEMPRGENKYYDEYSKEVQSQFILNKKDKNKLYKLSSNVKGSFGAMIDRFTEKGEGFRIDNDRDAAMYLSSFLKGFENGEIGKLQKRRIDYRKRRGIKREDTETKKSSNLQTMLDTDYDGNVRKMGRDAISVDPQGKKLEGKQAFDLMNSKLGQDIGPMVTDITKKLYDPIIDKGELTRQEYQNALIGIASEIIRTENFDPTKQDLDKFVSSRLYFRANALAKQLGVPQEFLKDIDNITDPTVDPDEDIDIALDEEARILNDFDIALEDGLVDAEITAEVESLIEQNPVDLEKRMEKLILGDIRKKLDNAIGKIAKNKETGIVEPTAEYETFIRDEFNEIISSLDIKTIRTSYKPFFKQEKTGRKDYKNIDPVTGKVSNYRKDTFINTASKPDFIKYFTQGKPNVLRERRTGLIRRISKRKADIAIDNYIERNSNNIDAVVKAKLRSISRTAENIQDEQTSFDSVKYSTQVETRINDYMKDEVDGKRRFANRGQALEQVIIDMLSEYGFPVERLKLRVSTQTEQGGLADINLEVFGEPFNIEVKLDEKVPMGSVLVSNYDLNYRNFTLAKSAIRLPFRDMLDMVHDDIVNLKNVYNEKVEAYNKKNGTNEPLMSDNPIGHRMVESIYNELVKEKVTGAIFSNSTFTSPNAQPLIDHYQGKTNVVGKGKNKKTISAPVDAIEIFGMGLYSFVPNSPLGTNAPYILNMARVQTGIRVMNSGRIKSKGKVVTNKAGDGYIRFSLQFQNTLTDLKAPKNPISLTRQQDMTPIFGAPVKQNLMPEVTLASKNARTTKKYHINPRGMSTFDFDETLIIEGKNFIVAKDPITGEETKISSGNWPLEGPKLAEQGYTFDFNDFVNVRGGVDGPLLQKMKNQISKFGPENVFVLTARPQASAPAIHGWLDSKGINIPFKNITGLANSTGDAKAEWMLQKFAEGYNDMYFVDDALPNVEAVKSALEQLDIKSDVQQARVKFSKQLDPTFNKILEEVVGIDADKRFSAIKARKRGEKKGRFRFFVPPSHEDFGGLLYNFLGKGKKGNEHRAFFEEALIRPLNRGYRELDIARQSIANDYKALNKNFPEIKNILNEKIPGSDFTNQDAIRIYLWNKHGYNIPGLSKVDQKKLTEHVKSDEEMQSYAETLNTISKQETYVNPTEGWDSGDIRMDLDDATGRVGRAEFFSEFTENAEEIFSEQNLNKIEAGYGKDVRSALEDMLYRIGTGKNRPKGQSATVNRFMNFLNGSVGSVMFLNMRSALLQQMSIVNYINFADNNIFAAAKAFANQKQYWTDWAYIFNSDMLKQRRGGIKTDVNGAELAETISKSRFPMRSLVRELLQLGFKPTQIGDSIAIATGGATYYRNRINRYQKQGLSRKDATEKAWNDFQDTTQSTQQSSRPDMVSQQQSSWKGKIILNFQNITSQYNRFGKKAMSDIYNRRISPPYTTQLQSDIGNASKIAFYFGIQNMIFYSLQTALFAMMFEDDENEERWLKKKERVINGSIDSILRGSGIGGAVLSTLKNMAIKFAEQRGKGYNPDESAVLMEMLNFSPVVGIKARKITNAEKTLFYNKNVIKEMDTFDIDNPMWSAYTNYIEAGTNLPLNRLYNKTQNVRQALNNEHEAWKRVMMSFGWSQYNLGIQDDTIKEVKETIKRKKKIQKDKEREQKKEAKIKEKYPNLNKKEIQVKLKSKEMFSLSKGEQYFILKQLGLSETQILNLKKEQNRADKIAELYEKNQKLIDDFMKNPKSMEIKKQKGFGDGKYKRKTYTRKSYTR
tara:strand:- start:537 stop:10187 length:9651 start_codon:yes stop_codon:yes gene_type:complete